MPILPSLISASQLTPDVISHLFKKTEEMEKVIEQHGRVNLLADKVVALLFFEPSSRTMLSFQTAAQRLKAGTIFAQGVDTTSLQKGESLEDTIRMVAGYSDIIVMRHAQSGSAKIAADTSDVPFINAGDGGNQHPTQALIDAYTIHRHVGRLDNLSVVLGYDALQSRSIHSLSQLLAQYQNNRLIFVGPPELRPDQAMLNKLEKLGAKCEISDNTIETDGADVIYLNRLQQERFKDELLFDQYRKQYRLSKAQAQSTDAIIMDPLPRIDEIDTEVDTLPNALYFKQASYGVPVRMALLAELLSNHS